MVDVAEKKKTYLDVSHSVMQSTWQ